MEASAKQDGRNMIMVIAPHKSSKARGQRTRDGEPTDIGPGAVDESDAGDAPEQGETPGAA